MTLAIGVVAVLLLTAAAVRYFENSHKISQSEVDWVIG